VPRARGGSLFQLPHLTDASCTGSLSAAYVGPTLGISPRPQASIGQRDILAEL